jgi:hypothetical protein
MQLLLTTLQQVSVMCDAKSTAGDAWCRVAQLMHIGRWSHQLKYQAETMRPCDAVQCAFPFSTFTAHCNVLFKLLLSSNAHAKSLMY